MTSSILRLALVGGAALTVAGCASDGYHGYGYAGASYGYSGPGYGWYEDYYYPGTGFYVYERSGKRHRWSDSQRLHWQSRHGDHDKDHMATVITHAAIITTVTTTAMVMAAITTAEAITAEAIATAAATTTTATTTIRTTGTDASGRSPAPRGSIGSPIPPRVK